MYQRFGYPIDTYNNPFRLHDIFPLGIETLPSFPSSEPSTSVTIVM